MGSSSCGLGITHSDSYIAECFNFIFNLEKIGTITVQPRSFMIKYNIPNKDIDVFHCLMRAHKIGFISNVGLS